MAYCLAAPSHHLSICWFLISEVLGALVPMKPHAWQMPRLFFPITGNCCFWNDYYISQKQRVKQKPVKLIGYIDMRVLISSSTQWGPWHITSISYERWFRWRLVAHWTQAATWTRSENLLVPRVKLECKVSTVRCHYNAVRYNMTPQTSPQLIISPRWASHGVPVINIIFWK